MECLAGDAAPTGTFCLVGVAPGPVTLLTLPMIFGQFSFAGSVIGSPQQIAEMLRFAALDAVRPAIEVLPLVQVNWRWTKYAGTRRGIAWCWSAKQVNRGIMTTYRRVIAALGLTESVFRRMEHVDVFGPMLDLFHWFDLGDESLTMRSNDHNTSQCLAYGDPGRSVSWPSLPSPMPWLTRGSMLILQWLYIGTPPYTSSNDTDDVLT